MRPAPRAGFELRLVLGNQHGDAARKRRRDPVRAVLSEYSWWNRQPRPGQGRLNQWRRGHDGTPANPELSGRMGSDEPPERVGAHCARPLLRPESTARHPRCGLLRNDRLGSDETAEDHVDLVRRAGVGELQPVPRERPGS